MKLIFRLFILSIVIITALYFLPAAAISETADVEVLWSYNTGDMIRNVHLSNNSQYVLVTSGDKDVLIFNRNGVLLSKYTLGGGGSVVDISGDGSYIVMGSSLDTAVELYTIDGTRLWKKNVNSTVGQIDISDDGQYIYVTTSTHWSFQGRNQNYLYLYDTAGNVIWQKTIDGEPEKMEVNDGTKDVLVLSNGYVADSYRGNVPIVYFTLYDKDGERLWQKGIKLTSGEDFKITSDGKYILIVLNNIYCLNRGGEPLWDILRPPLTVQGFSTDGEYFLVQSKRATGDRIYLVDLYEHEMWSLDTPNSYATVYTNGIYFALLSSHYTIGSSINSMNLFDFQGNQLWQYNFGEYLYSCDISNNGQYVAIGLSHGNVTLLRSFTGITSPANSSSNTTVVTGTGDNFENASAISILPVNNSPGIANFSANNTSVLTTGPATASSPHAATSGLQASLLYGIGAILALAIVAGGFVLLQKRRIVNAGPITILEKDFPEDENVVVNVGISPTYKNTRIRGSVLFSGTVFERFDSPGELSVNLGMLAPGKHPVSIEYVLTNGSKESKGTLSKDIQVLRANPLAGQKYVYIGYVDQDRGVAEAVCRKLEENGLKCWIAPRDVPPKIGRSRAVMSAINSSQVSVVVFSSRANVSPDIADDVKAAFDKGIPVVPLRLDDVPMSDVLSYYISAMQWVDALTPPVEKHLEPLYQAVKVLTDNK